LLKKDFLGGYTVLPEAIHAHLLRLFAIYPLPLEEAKELIRFIISLPDDQQEPMLAEFAEVATREAQKNSPLN
jgi:hypothetical protein